MLKLEPARWREWPGTSRLELWQAVILSLGLQPTADLESLATRDWNASRARDARDFRRIRGYEPPLELPEDFWDRLRRCQTNVSTDGPIRPQGAPHQGILTGPHCAVTLAEVASFLAGVGFTVPEAMKTPPAPADAPLAAPATAPSKAKHAEPAPNDVAGNADESQVPTQKQRQAWRYQMCVDAGLEMPTDDYASLPRGIGALAKREGITRQSFAEDVKAHIRRLHSR